MLRNKFNTLTIILAILPALVALFLLFPTKVNALSGSQFDAGRIIDNSVFFDGSAMSTNDIQNFLNAKMPNCDTWGTQAYGSTTRAAYAASKGVNTPFTCLKNYSQSVPSVASNEYCSGGIAGGNKSSASIIYDVAKACNTNPKVLLVLLQKEQSLVTDDWPWPVQYRSATGYGCPDTAPCDAEYYGFFNQVYQAAKAYNRYKINATNYNYRSGRNNTILWNPNAGCGSSTVYIQNQATAGLYIYTPYRPNQSALNNLYGTGDGCSSYGNRNFWRMFNDWFGNTYGIPFSAQLRSKSQTQILVYPNNPSTLWVNLENTGSYFWKDDVSAFTGYPRTRLMGTWPINRVSQFASPEWLSPNRPVSIFTKVYENDGVTLSNDQHTVWPGQVARFQFKVRYPTGSPSPGNYDEHFELVQDGAPNWWVPGSATNWSITTPWPFQASYSEQSQEANINNSTDGELWFKFKNTGSYFWKDDVSAFTGYPRTRLMGTWPINRVSQFASPEWLSPNRPVSIFTKVYENDGVTLSNDQHTVWPGQVALFKFKVKKPLSINNGRYKEHFELVQDGAPNWWVPGGYVWQTVNVN